MNPLEAAHAAVQARKEACGMPEMTSVISGAAEAPHKGEHNGMFTGTDLTEEQAFEAGQICAHAVARLLMTGEMNIVQALVATYIEGLLAGIEHGRKLGGS